MLIRLCNLDPLELHFNMVYLVLQWCIYFILRNISQFFWLATKAANQYSCHLVIPVFIFRRSSFCGDFKGKSLPSLRTIETNTAH